MLCSSGFELYSRWVPLYFTRKSQFRCQQLLMLSGKRSFDYILFLSIVLKQYFVKFLTSGAV